MSNTTTYHSHFFTKHHPFGGVTFLVERNTDNGHMRLAWAVCSEEDHYNRKTGRDVAASNMELNIFAEGEHVPQVPTVVNLCNILEEHNPENSWEQRYKEQALGMIEYVALKDAIFGDVIE